MTPIRITTDLAQLAGNARLFAHIESAVAIVGAQGELAYANPAFERFNRTLRCSAEDHAQYASLIECPEIVELRQLALDTRVSQVCCRAFFYNRRSPVTLTVVARPILQASGGSCLGAMLTIGEESIEFNDRQYARTQVAHQSLIDRVYSLSREKISSERLIRVLFKDAPFAMMLFNAKRQVIQVNKAGEALFGVSAPDLLGSSCEDLIECMQPCDGLATQPGARRIDIGEVYALTRDGRRIPLLRSAVTFADLDEVLILEAYVDLTERRQAEEKFRQLSEYNELVLNSTDEGIFGVDADLCCTFANPAAARLLGYTPDEMVGQDMHLLIHASREDGTLLKRSEVPIYKSIHGNIGHQENEAVFWCKNGSSIPVQYRCNPLHDHDRVMGAVVVYRNVSEARALARKMDYLATHDSLTGLLNRRIFEQRLETAIDVAYQDVTEHVLCFIDLDQFKIVNDTCGHSAGDEMLRQITGLLQEHIRKNDVLARLGGDEFAVLLERCDKAKGLEIIEKLRSVLSGYRFCWNQKIFSTSASMGVVMINRDIIDSTYAMGVADTACYVAKEKGRNRIHLYEVGDKELAQRHGEMQQVVQVREALAEHGFTLYYQPIVSLMAPQDLQRHMEILVRMRGVNGEPISPGAFIPAAERYHLMSAVDKAVVIETFKWLGCQYGALGQLDMCAINLSGQSVGDDQFLEFLLRALDEYALPAGILCFEVTETAAIANLARASQFIGKIKDRGHHFALDDFGSGMSSFRYLRNLPVDYLKIDGNFVKDMAHDKVDYAMVEAIHRVGRVMGIKTIAEFVENREVLVCLGDIGIDYAQGYGIAEPRPLQDRPTQETLTETTRPRVNARPRGMFPFGPRG